MLEDDAPENASHDPPPEKGGEEQNAGSDAGQADSHEMNTSPFEKPELESIDLSQDSFGGPPDAPPEALPRADDEGSRPPPSPPPPPPPDPEPDVTLTPFEKPETERLLEGDDEASSRP